VITSFLYLTGELAGTLCPGQCFIQDIKIQVPFKGLYRFLISADNTPPAAVIIETQNKKKREKKERKENG